MSSLSRSRRILAISVFRLTTSRYRPHSDGTVGWGDSKRSRSRFSRQQRFQMIKFSGDLKRKPMRRKNSLRVNNTVKSSRPLIGVFAALVLCSSLRADIRSRIVPSFVAELAASAFAKLPKSQQDNAALFHACFGFGFLEGFMSPEGAMHARSLPGMQLGY